jgi:hypothetical protein
MRRFLVVVVLALAFSVPSFAQRFRSASTPAATSLDSFYAVREKLIKAYTPNHVIWGVSICGEDDLLSDEEYTWLCVYAYKDTLKEFVETLPDVGKVEIKTVGNGNAKIIFVDGLPLQITLIERPEN